VCVYTVLVRQRQQASAAKTRTDSRLRDAEEQVTDSFQAHRLCEFAALASVCQGLSSCSIIMCGLLKPVMYSILVTLEKVQHCACSYSVYATVLYTKRLLLTLYVAANYTLLCPRLLSRKH
jgi:hypothetical protein